LALAPLKIESTGDWVGNSVLAAGSWYKVAVEQSGIHRLSYEQLQEIGLQNPASVSIYGTGARQLPEKFSEGYTDDLKPIPIYMDKGGDGMFSPGDYILFYAEGLLDWEYDQVEEFYLPEIHNYSLKGYYFLTDGQGPSVVPEDAVTEPGDPSVEVTQYDFRIHVEEETYNLINSGKEWYGDVFKVILEYNFPFQLPGELTGDPVKIRTSVAARSGEESLFSVSANNTFLGTIANRSTDLSHYTSTYAYENNETFSYIPQSGNLTVSLKYDQPDSDSEGWLNHIALNGRSYLTMEDIDELAFRDMKSTENGMVARYRLRNVDGSVIWEISDPSAPANVPYTPLGK